VVLTIVLVVLLFISRNPGISVSTIGSPNQSIFWFFCFFFCRLIEINPFLGFSVSSFAVKSKSIGFLVFSVSLSVTSIIYQFNIRLVNITPYYSMVFCSNADALLQDYCFDVNLTLFFI
jgi:hypothetical protein